MADKVNSKGFFAYLSNRKKLHNWLIKYTSKYNPENLGHAIYIALNGPPKLCKNEKFPLFNSYDLGYRIGCAKHCECVREHQAAKLIENNKEKLSKKPKETYYILLSAD